jgi:hypothetical protein
MSVYGCDTNRPMQNRRQISLPLSQTLMFRQAFHFTFLVATLGLKSCSSAALTRLDYIVPVESDFDANSLATVIHANDDTYIRETLKGPM